MQKNIAILIPTINAGGAEKQASLLASRLATKYNVCVILYSGEAKVNIANIQRLEEANIKIHKLIGGTFAKIQELKSLLKENNIEILFNYLTKPNFTGAIAARRVGAPKPVTIHDNVWLGYGVIVMKGVTIGKNSIVGMNSVVTKDIPANSVAAGSPAKVIKTINIQDN